MLKILLVPISLLTLYTFYNLISSHEVVREHKTAVAGVSIEAVDDFDHDNFDDKYLELLDERDVILDRIDAELNEEPKGEVIVPAALADPQAFIKEGSIEEAEKVISKKQGVEPLFAIKIDKSTIRQLEIGETLALPYMGGYEAKVSNKIVHKNGSVSITGNLVNADNNYVVVFTEGKSAIFGTVTTPDGAYEVETKNGQGYIYAVNDIDTKWIDYTQSDTVNPMR
jgi:hypothetical protein